VNVKFGNQVAVNWVQDLGIAGVGFEGLSNLGHAVIVVAGGVEMHMRMEHRRRKKSDH
jgi:hypothetical protein